MRSQPPRMASWTAVENVSVARDRGAPARPARTEVSFDSADWPARWMGSPRQMAKVTARDSDVTNLDITRERTHKTSDKRQKMGRQASVPSLLLVPQNNRQTGLRAPDHDHFRIRAVGQLLGGFDAFPLEQLGADALRHDPLEIGDALRLDALALRLLLLLLQHELHLFGFLLAPQLFLNRIRHHGRQADFPEQHLLHQNAALARQLPEERKDLACDSVALGGIERLRLVRRRDLANRRPELRLDDR